MSKMIPLSGLVAAMLLPLHFAAPVLAADKIAVVASFSILADLVRQVGGDRVAVTSFVGPNTDMHVFQPAPGDAKRLLDAKLVVINGLGFEGWADRLVKASGYKGPLVVATKGIKPIEAKEEGKDHAHGHSDPHAWQDIANVKIYVGNIRDALIAADAGGKAQYEVAASDYLKQLETADAEIKAAMGAIPKPARRVITSHDAFGYFGRAYGIEFLAPQGVGGDSEPTAKDVANLIRQIKRERVKAVFVENISNPRVIERIAKETGVTPGGALYSDALSEPSGPAGTYLAMMRHNARLMTAAMK
jgi:zinc/manganese transport system substrate-binding protein